mgnify:CR=1 FL=1
MENQKIVRCKPGDDVFESFVSLTDLVYTKEVASAKKIQKVNSSFLFNAYVAFKNNTAVARCILFNNPYLKYESKRAFCFGYFEALNEPVCVNQMLSEVEKDATSAGASWLIGPMNGSTWDDYRLDAESEHPSFFLESRYPAYYHTLLQKAGFSSIARYVSHRDSDGNVHEERIARTEALFNGAGVTFRNIDLEHYEDELIKLHHFCMSAFRNNFLFTPVSLRDFVEKYMKIKPAIDPRFVILAENRNREMVGVIFCLHNFNDKQEKGLIIKTIAKHPSFRYGGMGPLLGTLIKKKALECGYCYLLHAFMIDFNASRSLSEHFAGRPIREYYLYAKNLG